MESVSECIKGTQVSIDDIRLNIAEVQKYHSDCIWTDFTIAIHENDHLAVWDCGTN